MEQMRSSSSRGVRKGAWTKEEDILLTRCISSCHSQGMIIKWHQLPLRAGLNRCRKSCRLRWLNYLDPAIKRGSFTHDEVDLIARLHKLLGNKWSLIAGRIPGRTANDIKNYWNAHMDKKLDLRKQTRFGSHIHNIDEQKPRVAPSPTSNIFRPKPWSFARRRMDEGSDANKQKQCAGERLGSQTKADDCVEWWSKLLQSTESGQLIKGPLEDILIGEASSPSGLDDGVYSFSKFDHEPLNLDE